MLTIALSNFGAGRDVKLFIHCWCSLTVRGVNGRESTFVLDSLLKVSNAAVSRVDRVLEGLGG